MRVGHPTARGFRLPSRAAAGVFAVLLLALVAANGRWPPSRVRA